MENNDHILKNKIKTFFNLDESAQVEFKSAKGGFPGSFWESYSAFANTDGGVIVLGVLDKNKQFYFDGLGNEQVAFTGGRSVCRNPILQSLFMRIGRSEKAGSGVDKILAGWEYLGMPVPQVKEDTHPDYVVLRLPLKKSNETNTLQVDSKIIDSENNNITITPPQVTPQVTNVSVRKKRIENRVLTYCKRPRSLTEILQHLGLKDRKNFMEGYINPMLADGRLSMTDSENPTSSIQKYIRNIP